MGNPLPSKHLGAKQAEPADADTPRIFGVPPQLWLLLACIALYAGRLSVALFFDDVEAILENPTLHPMHFPQVLFAPPDTPTAGRPLANLSFALGHVVFGNSLLAVHALNLTLHILVTWVGFLLLRTTFSHGRVAPTLKHRATPLAFAAALLFAVHPVGVEIVLYATQRTEALVTLFYLCALLVLAAAAVRGRVRTRDVTLMAAIALLGAASKEVFATAAVIGLFFDRAFFAGSFAQALRARGKLYAALMLGVVVLALLQSTHPRPVTVIGFTMPYLMAQTRIVPGYLAQALWPAHPVLDYGPLVAHNGDTSWPFILLTLMLVLTSAVLAFARPRLGFLGVVVFGVLAPSSSVFTILTEIGAQRRIYLVLFALLAYVVVLLEAAVRSASDDNRTTPNELVIFACVLAAAFGVRARAYADTFQSGLAIWTTAVEARPQNPRAYDNLAQEYLQRGNFDAGEAASRAALRVHDKYPPAYNTLGFIAYSRGDAKTAIAMFERAIELGLRGNRVRNNLAAAQKQLEDQNATR